MLGIIPPMDRQQLNHLMDNMKTVIRAAVERKGGNMKGLSKSAGLSETYIRDFLERDRAPTFDKLMPLLAALDLTLADIDPDSAGSLPEGGHGGTPASFSTLGPSGIPPQTIAEIDLRAGMGSGGLPVEYVNEQNGIVFSAVAVRDYWRLPDWLLSSRFNVSASKIAAFQVQGDSMLPTLLDGDVVFIDTSHRVPSPPGIYALADDFGGVIVKRLEVISKRGEDEIRIQVSSDNDRHRPYERTLEEIHIVGRYLGRFTI